MEKHKSLHKFMSPLCFMPNGDMVCFLKGCVVVMRDNREISKVRISHSIIESLFGSIKLFFRLFRNGIRTAIALNETTIVYSKGNGIYELNVYSGEISDGFFCRKGVRPLAFSKIMDVDSIENGIYFGEYLQNPDKRPVNVYKRVDKDNWIVCYTFELGLVNHIHNILSDSYRKCIWVFTGDFGDSAAIWRITDNFRVVERYLYNDQMYRSCVAYALPEGVLYVTDSPYAVNHIYLMKDGQTIENICEIDGSCIYGCQVGNKFAFSTAVEPDGRQNTILRLLISRKRGSGIKDNYSHLYVGNISLGFNEIYKEKKDVWPYIFQFGVMRFPYGDNPTGKLYFQPVATDKYDLHLMTIE